MLSKVPGHRATASPAGGAGSPVRQVETAGAVKPAASQVVPLGHPPEECSTRVAGQPSVVNPGLGHLNIADTATAHSLKIFGICSKLLNTELSTRAFYAAMRIKKSQNSFGLRPHSLTSLVSFF